ncbi:hypothetical protein QBC39DRAFT_70618 [Podospora conica]|nr:hypothetical protein QBC39DRAFT_70618 [Schizothecium conicum]
MAQSHPARSGSLHGKIVGAGCPARSAPIYRPRESNITPLSHSLIDLSLWCLCYERRQGGKLQAGAVKRLAGQKRRARPCVCKFGNRFWPSRSRFIQSSRTSYKVSRAEVSSQATTQHQQPTPVSKSQQEVTNQVQEKHPRSLQDIARRVTQDSGLPRPSQGKAGCAGDPLAPDHHGSGHWSSGCWWQQQGQVKLCPGGG